MIIVHVIASIDPAKGGPQAVVVRLAAAQAALGHQVYIVSYADPEAEKRARHAAASVPNVRAVRWAIMPPASALERAIGRGARAVLAPLIERADVVHIHGVWETLLRIAAGLARRRGVPYCVLPHGMLDRWSLGQKAWKKRLALRLAYRRMLDGAAFIQVLNEDEATLMRPADLLPRRVVIPNGVFLQEIEPLPPAGSFRATQPVLGGRPYVLFLSRLHAKKGLDILAEAFTQVAAAEPNVDLVVAGPDDGAAADFNARIAAARLSRRVHVVGPLYGPAKLAALRDAACFCLPSRQEGFSVAITEALACGVPAVVSEACHFPEVAGSEAGMVLPLDAEVFAGALLRILRDPAAAQRMGRNGRELVTSRFTWPRIAEATLAAYAAHQRHTGTVQRRLVAGEA